MFNNFRREWTFPPSVRAWKAISPYRAISLAEPALPLSSERETEKDRSLWKRDCLQGHTSTRVYCAWIAIRQKQTRSGLPTSLQPLQQCPNTHGYSYNPIRRYSFSCGHSWRKRSFALKIIVIEKLLNVERRWHACRKALKTWPHAKGNCSRQVHEWNFSKLISLVCTGHNDKDNTAN